MSITHCMGMQVGEKVNCELMLFLVTVVSSVDSMPANHLRPADLPD